MAVPGSTVWDRDPHTEAKHRVLQGYLEAWYPIMLSRFRRLTVFEGYAGPGVYSEGEDGSPVIALRALLEHAQLLDDGREVHFVFVEEREDRFRRLQTVIGERFPVLPPGVFVNYHHGSCEDTWEAALDQANARGMPVFANLDPFGPGVPHGLVAALGANKSSEVLVTFMSNWLRRFWSLEDIDGGDVQFGSPAWRRVGELNTPAEKEAFLVGKYRSTLRNVGLDLSTAFRMSDEGGRSFYLIFGTSHRRGLEKMKESMWKTDAVTGIQFRDPRDPKQGVLDFGEAEPDISPLIRMIELELQQHPNGQTVEELKDFALFETAFRPPHVTGALNKMLEEGAIARMPAKGQLTKAVRVTLRP